MEQDHAKNEGKKGKEKMLSRDAVKQKLIGWGIAEPTDEQISDYLAQIGNEIKSAEDRANRYKEDSLRAKDLAKELEELKTANLTDAEKSAKAVEDANKRVAELEQTVASMKLFSSLAEIGIKGDDAETLINEDGSLNTAKLGEILSNREKSAVASYQKKVLDETPSPSGGKSEEEDKDAEIKEYAQAFADRAKANNEAKDIVNHYV